MKLKHVLIGGSLLAVSGLASASTGVDVSGASNAFTEVATAVGTIGPLMIGAVAAGIVAKWVVAFLI